MVADGTQFRFGKDSDGNYGYIVTDETGADTVIPFSSGVKIIKLGTDTSYDIKSLYPNIDYTKLTSDNFFTKDVKAGNSSQVPNNYLAWNYRVYFTPSTVSYNSSTGVLTVTRGSALSVTETYGAPSNNEFRLAAYTTTTVYMIV